MSTSLKSPNGMKDAECKKGQLSHRPPIPYVPVIDVVMPKEEPKLYKVKLPDTSHLSIPILPGAQQGTLGMLLQSFA